MMSVTMSDGAVAGPFSWRHGPFYSTLDSPTNEQTQRAHSTHRR